MQIQQRINFAINGGYYQYSTNVESWWVDHWGYDDPSTHTIGLMSHPSPIGPDNPVSGDGIRDYPIYLNSQDDARWWFRHSRRQEGHDGSGQPDRGLGPILQSFRLYGWPGNLESLPFRVGVSQSWIPRI